MTLDVQTDEAQRIEEAHAMLLAQSAKTEFDPEPYERATRLLESLPPTDFVDARVKLAWDICVGTATLIRPDIARRALYASFPAGTKLRDKFLERNRFTATGLLEAQAGNVQRALKYKMLSFELSQELNDPAGIATEWNNLAFMVSGAGLYEDAIQYATFSMKVGGMRNEELAKRYGAACVIRANASFRLGRFNDAIRDLAGALGSITHPASGQTLQRLVMGQCLLCEIALAKGDLEASRTALSAATTWADRCGLPRIELQIERVRALLAMPECGVEAGMVRLEQLLQQATAIEVQEQTPIDDVVLDILQSLESVSREHCGREQADGWLDAISSRMRRNAAKTIAALSDSAFLSEPIAVEAKVAEVDRYLRSKRITSQSKLDRSSYSWSYLVGLAASATSAEDATKEHGLRVARLAGLVARELGLPRELRKGIEDGCLVHDVGKVEVLSTILLRTTNLDDGEQKIYDAHPSAGAELLERIELPSFTTIQNVVRFHHHSYSGDAGNPGLRGEALPLEARIASVCDEYDSLVTGRPRRPAISSNDALREIFAQRSGKFDPKIVDVFVEIVRALHRTHSDLQAYLSDEAESIEYFAMQRTLKRAAQHALSNDRVST